MPDDKWIQYGSFGILAFIMLYGMVYGLPNLLRTHKETVEELVTAHKEAVDKVVASAEVEAKACRADRLAAEKAAAEEREKDREARHELANQFQDTINKIVVYKEVK